MYSKRFDVNLQGTTRGYLEQPDRLPHGGVVQIRVVRVPAEKTCKKCGVLLAAASRVWAPVFKERSIVNDERIKVRYAVWHYRETYVRRSFVEKQNIDQRRLIKALLCA